MAIHLYKTSFLNTVLNYQNLVKNLEGYIRQMGYIQIDVSEELFNERNNNISEFTKNFMINCLGLINGEITKIMSLDLCQNSINDSKIKKIFKLNNIMKEECKGISNKVIVEYAAICINLCTIPIHFAYKNIEVIQVGHGSDYICYGNINNFIFESKGVNSKYNCPTQARKGLDQINKSFKIFRSKNIEFGIVGVSCFYEKKHYLIEKRN